MSQEDNCWIRPDDIIDFMISQDKVILGLIFDKQAYHYNNCDG